LKGWDKEREGGGEKEDRWMHATVVSKIAKQLKKSIVIRIFD